jgi:hypothetical protein
VSSDKPWALRDEIWGRNGMLEGQVLRGAEGSGRFLE